MMTFEREDAVSTIKKVRGGEEVALQKASNRKASSSSKPGGLGLASTRHREWMQRIFRRKGFGWRRSWAGTDYLYGVALAAPT
jgi:hypothetical protein